MELSWYWCQHRTVLSLSILFPCPQTIKSPDKLRVVEPAWAGEIAQGLFVLFRVIDAR